MVGVRAEDSLNLVERIVNPICDFIGCGLISHDIRADKIFDSIGAAVFFGQDMMDVPSAIDILTMPPNKIVGVTISRATHKIAVKVLGKFHFPKTFIP